MYVRSRDAEIFYDVAGSGPPVILLHPFPANHEFWTPVAEALSTRYRLIMPDLRAHAESSLGEGIATMEKHADDIARVCDEAGVGRAVFAGISIGGYVLFEFWRRHRERVSALVLANTKAAADTQEARAARLQSAREVLEQGPDRFIEGMIPKVLGETTRTNRPDVVDRARRMMMSTSAEGISRAQQGMAERPDSAPTLALINVPTLIIAGDEDVATPIADAEAMHRSIRGSQLRVVGKAGHFAAFERPEEAAALLREFLGQLPPR
ncbi:MAG TPA: alpha/beta fold hydrolase [Clostridia bacterium]|nr:alpha/beta fold hydrolase [Clostridia bacterium]